MSQNWHSSSVPKYWQLTEHRQVHQVAPLDRRRDLAHQLAAGERCRGTVSGYGASSTSQTFWLTVPAARARRRPHRLDTATRAFSRTDTIVRRRSCGPPRERDLLRRARGSRPAPCWSMRHQSNEKMKYAFGLKRAESCSAASVNAMPRRSKSSLKSASSGRSSNSLRQAQYVVVCASRRCAATCCLVPFGFFGSCRASGVQHLEFDATVLAGRRWCCCRRLGGARAVALDPVNRLGSSAGSFALK